MKGPESGGPPKRFRPTVIDDPDSGRPPADLGECIDGLFRALCLPADPNAAYNGGGSGGTETRASDEQTDG